MPVFQDAPGTPGTTGVGQGSTSAQVSDKTPWTVLSDSVFLNLSQSQAQKLKLTCNHKSQASGWFTETPKSPKGPEGLSLRTHLRLLKETPDSGLVTSGELLCLGLPTQDVMDPMGPQDSHTAAAAG